MNKLARGYIASGEFQGNRAPQHLQNQVVKAYCDANNLQFVLSRAEYWIDGSTKCQLWAALREGFSDIVFFSLWLLPENKHERQKIYDFCYKNRIILHFAVERMSLHLSASCIADVEILIESNLVMLRDPGYSEYLARLKELL